MDFKIILKIMDLDFFEFTVRHEFCFANFGDVSKLGTGKISWNPEDTCLYVVLVVGNLGILKHLMLRCIHIANPNNPALFLRQKICTFCKFPRIWHSLPVFNGWKDSKFERIVFQASLGEVWPGRVLQMAV